MQKKLTKKEQEALTLKEKICDNLKDKKTFNFEWCEETLYTAKIKAGSEAEAKTMWEMGAYDSDIEDYNYIDDSLEITEEEESKWKIKK